MIDTLTKLAPLIKDLAPILREFFVAIVLGAIIFWQARLMRRDEKRVDRLTEQQGRMISIMDVQAQTLAVLGRLDDRYHRLVLLVTRVAGKLKIDLIDIVELGEPEPPPAAAPKAPEKGAK